MKRLRLALLALLVFSFTAANVFGSGWKPYLDLVLKGDGVKSAGIFGQDGAAWSTTDDFKLSAQEVKDIVAGIKNNSLFSPPRGVVVQGQKFMFLKALSDTHIVARKGPTSLMAITSTKAVIILTTQDKANPANITSHEFVASDLIKKQF